MEKIDLSEYSEGSLEGYSKSSEKGVIDMNNADADIFQLTWQTYESEINYYFKSIHKDKNFEDFEDSCDIIMRDAAQDAVEGKPWMTFSDPEILIGYDVLIDEVRARLPQYGFHEVKFKTVEYKHNIIIDDIDEVSDIFGEILAKKIVKHNENLCNKEQ